MKEIVIYKTRQTLKKYKFIINIIANKYIT